MCLILSVAWNVCGRCHGDTRRIPPSKREQIQLMRGHTHTYTHTTWHNIHDPTANGGMVTPRWTPTEAPLLDSLHCAPPKRNKPVEVYNTTAAHTADCFEMSLVTANLLSCLPVLRFCFFFFIFLNSACFCFCICLRQEVSVWRGEIRMQGEPHPSTHPRHKQVWRACHRLKLFRGGSSATSRYVWDECASPLIVPAESVRAFGVLAH